MFLKNQNTSSNMTLKKLRKKASLNSRYILVSNIFCYIYIECCFKHRIYSHNNCFKL